MRKLLFLNFLIEKDTNIHARIDEFLKESCKWNGDKNLLRYIRDLDIDYFLFQNTMEYKNFLLIL